MKTLDLNACGVSEMNKSEMAEVNGGGILTFMAICAGLILFIEFLNAYND